MRVLIAEDDPISRRLLQVFLSKAGYEVEMAVDGVEALKALTQQECPKLVILDWMMPHVDGVEVCRAIRQRPPDPYIYIILLTAKADQQEILVGFAAGADDYITKPFNAQELKARLRTGKRILDLQQQLTEQATHDVLTGFLTRRAIFEVLERESVRSVREKIPVAVIMADLDHFKQVNDTFGHLTGDRVLQETARRIKQSVREYDRVGRYGGEEFLIVAPGCGTAEALRLAERLRLCICAQPMEGAECIVPITMSLGVAAASDAVTSQQLLGAADQALYLAKSGGRNRVAVPAGAIAVEVPG